MKSLGERLRELRAAADLSLRELGKKLGVSPAFLSDVELGRRHPTDKLLEEIARKLGASLEDLRNYDTRPPIEEVRRRAASNPAYGLAFRKVIDQDVSAEEILKWLEKRGGRGKKS